MNFDKVILKKTKCIICNKRKHVKLFDAKYLFFDLEGKYNIVKCVNCGLIRTDPLPTISTMKYYYPKNYSPYIDTQAKKTSSQFKKNIKNILHFFFDTKGQAIPNLQSGNMLDIGCASGHYLHEMKKKGWNVFGIETSKDAVTYARKKFNLRVFNGPIEKAKKPKCTYLDLIVGWMTAEHLHNPILAFKKLRAWSTKSTYLVLSIPNADSFEFNLFKNNWFALQVPTHVHHFTPKTIKKVLDISGWKVEKIIHQRTIANIIASIGNILKSYGFIKIGTSLINYTSNPLKFNYLFYPISLIQAFFRQSGRITIWARKK